MANIQKVIGRHRWIEGYRIVGHTGEKRECLKCTNCAKTHDLGHGDPPVVGCFSDVDISRFGTAMQQDQLGRDMRGGLYR